ncbi:hypothetical protein KUTeg_023875 [Tegillarca granosa]|uniref:DNA helicase MCM8 n=1 Tax=Tegillarca granosa TaxID=220873 RepID=A0ABQ9E8I4_TEGGR|nr:hypothetical protein KUTeg_023875 [Tegillarca granosa]
MSQNSNYSNNGRGGGWRGGGGRWRGRGGWGRGRGGGGKYYSNYGNRGRGSGGSQSQRGGSQRGGPVLMEDPQPSRRTGPQMVQTRIEVQSPYKGWSLYFPDEIYNDHSSTVQKVQVFEKYFLSWKDTFNWDDMEDKGSFIVDFKEIITDRIISEGIPELMTEMKDMPDKILGCMGLAVHQILTHQRLREAAESEENGGSIQTNYTVPLLSARVVNYGSPVPLKNLKANYYGKFVSVKGTVVRVSNIKPMCTKLAFECNNCSTEQCPAHECRIQEIMGDHQKETGRIPRTVDCELTQDLVDSCVPGDIVTVSGIVKVNSVEEGRSRNKDKCMFLLYIHANSVSNAKGNKSGDSSGLAMDFTMKELYAIEEIQSEKNLFRSLCPSIYGHELVKAGLILGLFGGSQKYTNDKNRIPVRGDPHILVVGDPGLGKSQMLQSVSNSAPRSVYVCGNTTTTSGLTVTLSKDGGSGDFALEAGALVLADQGCCCIDEFDKMSNQHQALLEAMEQQSITRTSIIAAANPVGGHYNKGKTVAENLKMGSALLSRFDLVFILLDKPDESYFMQQNMNTLKINTSANESLLFVETDKPLSERLKVSNREPFDPIPNQLLRKYVGYARKYVHPKIGPDAAKTLQEFYLELRRQHQTQDSTPITTRQLESLIRLTEARARLELREEATKEDAEDVIEIMKYRPRKKGWPIHHYWFIALPLYNGGTQYSTKIMFYFNHPGLEKKRPRKKVGHSSLLVHALSLYNGSTQYSTKIMFYFNHPGLEKKVGHSSLLVHALSLYNGRTQYSTKIMFYFNHPGLEKKVGHSSLLVHALPLYNGGTQYSTKIMFYFNHPGLEKRLAIHHYWFVALPLYNGAKEMSIRYNFLKILYLLVDFTYVMPIKAVQSKIDSVLLQLRLSVHNFFVNQIDVWAKIIKYGGNNSVFIDSRKDRNAARRSNLKLLKTPSSKHNLMKRNQRKCRFRIFKH